VIHLLGTRAKCLQSAPDWLSPKLAARYQPLAQPDNPRKRIDDLETLPVGWDLRDQQPAIIGAEVDRGERVAGFGGCARYPALGTRPVLGRPVRPPIRLLLHGHQILNLCAPA